MNGTTAAVVTDARSLTLHEVCQVWPALPDEELESLGRSILERGLLVPILVYRGRIIDGRHRWIAALNVGYTFKPGDFVEHDDECTIVATVHALNSERRQLTPDQRRAIAAELREAIAREMEEAKRRKCSDAGRQGGRGNQKGGTASCATLSRRADRADSTRKAAKLMGVGEDGVRAAAAIKEASPETHKEVKEGRKTIKEAKQELGIGTPKGRCRINGVEQPDTPEVAAMRRKGKIALDVVIDVQEPYSSTTREAVEEEYEERAAIRDDLSDKDWFEQLPLAGVLEHQQLATFREDAMTYRALQGARKTFARQAAMAVNKTRRDGAYIWRLRSFLKVEPPDRWKLCCDPSQQGCGGKGIRKVMGTERECEKCHGRGYWIL